jgi:hypothetical protein
LPYPLDKNKSESIGVKYDLKLSNYIRKTGIMKYSGEFEKWILPAEKQVVLNLIEKLLPYAKISISSGVIFDDTILFRLLQEQDSFNLPGYKTCPIKYFERLQHKTIIKTR